MIPVKATTSSSLARRLASHPTASTAHMERGERVAGDLRRLASEDGCIAAAWALEVLDELVPAHTVHICHIGR